MAVELLVLVVIAIGLFFSFTLKGAEARAARKWYLIGICVALGGCLGSLGWLSGETSGNGNFATSINPFIWAGLLLLGTGIVFVNSLRVIKLRSRQKHQPPPPPDPPRESGENDHTREF